MKSHQFDTYEEYVKSQRMLTLRKVRKYKVRVFTTPEVAQTIRDHHKTNTVHGLCHGVRLGKEMEFFEEVFPDMNWIGTEITKELCDGRRILCRDFSVLEDDWEGQFDIIYSNSFDHSRNPYRTGRLWKSCLNKTGRLYIEWTPWHNKLGARGNKADCYAADENEYLDLWSKVGQVEAVLTVPEDGFDRKIFVVK